jgi:SAM-dependent methyltransferase
VVGHKHLDSWAARWWRGSISGALIEHAPCSVLVVIIHYRSAGRMPVPTGSGRRPDPSLALTQYRRRAEHYDFELMPFEPVRRDAIASLDCDAGATVLDVGCGTGLSFEALKQRVGSAGRIVGIEPCPEMLARARQRVEQRGWSGIELLQADGAAGAAAGPRRCGAVPLHA